LSGQECDENQTPEPESNTSDKNNSPDNSLFDIELKTANDQEISTAIQLIAELAEGGRETISMTLIQGSLKKHKISHAFVAALDYVERMGLGRVDRSAGLLRLGGTP
jgi:hypothetical protein